MRVRVHKDNVANFVALCQTLNLVLTHLPNITDYRDRFVGYHVTTHGVPGLTANEPNDEQQEVLKFYCEVVNK